MSPTRSSKKSGDAPVEITAEHFVGDDARLSVPFAGLLVDHPELAEATLTREAWQQRLETYLASPRP